MRRLTAATLLLTAALPTVVWAQSPITPPSVPLSAPTLNVTLSERQYFQFGYMLAKASFSYAELAKQATRVSQNPSKLAQVRQLAKLYPLAQHDRSQASEGMARALALMGELHAPASATEVVTQALARLNKPLAMSRDARTVALFNSEAGHTLAALDEFERLSSVAESPVIERWLAAPSTARSGKVWYAEGLMAALAEVAAAQQMPELLPPATEIATDLRGLRDWLALRLPDEPTPDQAALKQALDDFLHQTTLLKTPKKFLTPSQLDALGDISQKLQAQILNTPDPAAPNDIKKPPTS